MPDQSHRIDLGPGSLSTDAPVTDIESDPLQAAVIKAAERGGWDPDSPAQRLLENALDIQDYERKRLGQELHDAAGQLLISLQFSIARLRSVMDKSEQTSIVDEIGDIVGRVDEEIRSLTFLQYPAELNSSGVCTAVQRLALGFGRRTGIETKFKCVGNAAAANEQVSLSLLRVAQEALTNIYRHAQAHAANVVLEGRPDRLHLTVTDDGIGIAPEAAKENRGVGLTSMRQRVESLGGRFTIRKLKDGTRVSATVPVGGKDIRKLYA